MRDVGSRRVLHAGTYIGSRWSLEVALVRQLINESTAWLAYRDRGDSVQRGAEPIYCVHQ